MSNMLPLATKKAPKDVGFILTLHMLKMVVRGVKCQREQLSASTISCVEINQSDRALY